MRSILGFLVSGVLGIVGLIAMAPTFICFDECSTVGAGAIAILIVSWAGAWIVAVLSWKALKKEQGRWPY